MKKFIFIFLSMMTFCKAADWNNTQTWYDNVKQHGMYENKQILRLQGRGIKNIPVNLDLPNVMVIDLSNNEIQTIPEGLVLSDLEILNLSKNQINGFNAKRLLKQFPKLRRIFLNKNPLPQYFVDELTTEATKAGREIYIEASDLLEGEDIKGG